MILVGSFLLLNVAGIAQTPIKGEVRALYQRAVTDEGAAEKLIKMLKPFNSKNNPLWAGYKASVTMLLAEHTFNPFKKLKYFNKGKKMLQEAVEADRTNIELRFLRFTAQSNAPSFLGYDDHIQADKKFLLQKVPQLSDATLKKYLISSLQMTEVGHALEQNVNN